MRYRYGMNLFTALRAAWPATLDDAAILTDAGIYTWSDLDRASAMLANLLQSLHLLLQNKLKYSRNPQLLRQFRLHRMIHTKIEFLHLLLQEEKLLIKGSS